MIGSSENRVTYNGNGSATEFAFQFKILQQSDLKVLLVEKDGTERVLTKDYYVDMEKNVVIYPGYAPGAEIPESARPPVLPVGSKLVLYREVPITQNSSLDKYWPFNVIEAMADKLTIICQQLADGFTRCLKLSVGAEKGVDTTIPVGADKSFKWDSTGKKIVLTEDPANVLPVSKDILNQTIAAKNEAVKHGEIAVNSAISAAQSETEADAAMRETKRILEQTTETAKNVNVFIPTVDENGNISWTNRMGAKNPETQNIKGPQGVQGAAGIQGPKGDQGERGPQGIQGIAGPQGPQGVQGPKGNTGPKGEQGAKGDTGAVGPQGKQGVVGPQGAQGIQGPKGEKGDVGATGKQGVVGPQGAQGIQGPKGDKGEQGPQGISGIQVTTKGYYVFLVRDGKLICAYDDSNEAPSFKLRPDGHLVYEMEVDA